MKFGSYFFLLARFAALATPYVLVGYLACGVFWPFLTALRGVVDSAPHPASFGPNSKQLS